jgi:hypothetical protein
MSVKMLHPAGFLCMPFSARWTGVALTFAVAAPAATLGCALLRAVGSGPYQIVRGPLLIQGAIAGAGLVALMAAAFVWRRGRRITGVEAFLLWLGATLSFAWLFGFIAVNSPTLTLALRLSPYLFDAVLWGLVPPLIVGLGLLIAWRRR